MINPVAVFFTSTSEPWRDLGSSDLVLRSRAADELVAAVYEDPAFGHMAYLAAGQDEVMASAAISDAAVALWRRFANSPMTECESVAGVVGYAATTIRNAAYALLKAEGVRAKYECNAAEAEDQQGIEGHFVEPVSDWETHDEYEHFRSFVLENNTRAGRLLDALKKLEVAPQEHRAAAVVTAHLGISKATYHRWRRALEALGVTYGLDGLAPAA